MPKTFKDLMSELATDTSENARYSAEEIQEVVSEVTAKDTRIQELEQALEKANKDHEDLKSRIVEKLFAVINLLSIASNLKDMLAFPQYKIPHNLQFC